MCCGFRQIRATSAARAASRLSIPVRIWWRTASSFTSSARRSVAKTWFGVSLPLRKMPRTMASPIVPQPMTASVLFPSSMGRELSHFAPSPLADRQQLTESGRRYHSRAQYPPSSQAQRPPGQLQYWSTGVPLSQTGR